MRVKSWSWPSGPQQAPRDEKDGERKLKLRNVDQFPLMDPDHVNCSNSQQAVLLTVSNLQPIPSRNYQPIKIGFSLIFTFASLIQFIE